MSDWLDLELAHRLTPMEAPEGLWERVENGLRPPVRRSAFTNRLWAWQMAAMATVVLAMGALWIANLKEPALDIRQLAASGQWRSTDLGLRSQDPGEIRRWLRRQAGLDVPLPASTAVRLDGARVLRRGGQRVAAVEYRVGRDTVTLLVAKADLRTPLPAHGGRVAAWQAHDQVYAVAGSTGRVEAACQLCHASL
jgi:hypothetical protein